MTRTISRPYISVILPSIRPFLLENVYNSIVGACQHLSFELIVISPYNLPDSFSAAYNVKLIKDYGQPSRCAQLGLLYAEGKRVTLLSDDCTVLGNAYVGIEEQFNRIDANEDRKFIGLKYSEGQSMQDPGYWKAKSHPALQLDGLRDDMPVSSMIYMSKQGLLDIGGWDCSIFECINWGGHDLTARMLNAGYKFELTPQSFCHTAWGPGIDGLYNDHRPLWESDQLGAGNLKKLWEKPNPTRIECPLDNWKQATYIWGRRFK
jgi:hypothetical protein